MVLHIAASNWISAPVESFEWGWFNIYNSLVRFCVPAFVMISGIFFLNPNKEIRLSVLFKKYILRIVIAFLAWSFIYASSGFIFDLIKGEGLKWKQLATETILGQTHLWFLYMIAGLYLIVPFLKKITAHKHLTEFFLILWFVFSIAIPTIQEIPVFSKSTVITDKLNLNFVLGFSGYFVMGYYLNAYKLSRKMEFISYVMGGVGVVATILITQILSTSRGEPIRIYYDNFKPNVMLVAIAIFVFFSQRISKIQFSDKCKTIITTVSAYSFGMYLVHYFFIILFEKTGFSTMLFNPIVSVPLISVCIFLGSFCIVYLLKKFKFIRDYLI
jgi:surface polysaccharide O-acyltransferase-like enzyme